MVHAFILAALLCPQEQAERSYRDLLADVYDLRRLTVPPAEGERALQFSSWDRASSGGPGSGDAWFANADHGQFLRVEERTLPDGSVQKEHVLADVSGPGVVTRIWSANPDGDLLFYVDGAAEPALRVPFQDLCRGDRSPFLEPLCGVQARGWNCYVPLPFQKHLKLAATTGGFYYHVNVRLLPPGSKVPSVSEQLLVDNLGPIREACDILREGRTRPVPEGNSRYWANVKPGKTIDHPLRGEGTVRELWVAISPVWKVKDLTAALRAMRIQILVDDVATPIVDCPMGDFFGGGPGLLSCGTYAVGMEPNGKLFCRLPIPFRAGFHLKLVNEGSEAVNLSTDLIFDKKASGPLVLHAAWKQERDLPTRPFRDYRVLEAAGPGRFVGCSLQVRNPSRAWWGEGDEKFFVDGEKFPSTFGTGTEDYFGYAWGSSEVFNHPLHAQPRCDGPGSYGYTSVNRFQHADHVPFQKSFVFDLEVWHWDTTVKVDYTTVAYWYAPPEAGHGLPPLPPVEERLAPPMPPLEVFRVASALEGEALRVLAVTRGETAQQDMDGFGKEWSGERQLWWTGGQPGDTLVLEVPVEKDGHYRLRAQLTKADDYGIVTLMLNGKPLGPPVDLYAEKVSATGALDLGEHNLSEGISRFALRIEGCNERAKPAYMAGVDYLLLEPVGGAAEGQAGAAEGRADGG